MKWWQDKRKAILRPEQRITPTVWIVVAFVGGVALLVDLARRWLA